MDKEFFKNEFGVNIVKCCASCKHKEFGKTGTRVCTNGEGEVKPSYLCSDWEMSERLAKAGKGGGPVKKARYLQYVLNYEQPKEPQYHVPLKAIRAEYEKLYGSIYICE